MDCGASALVSKALRSHTRACEGHAGVSVVVGAYGSVRRAYSGAVSNVEVSPVGYVAPVSGSLVKTARKSLGSVVGRVDGELTKSAVMGRTGHVGRLGAYLLTDVPLGIRYPEASIVALAVPLAGMVPLKAGSMLVVERLGSRLRPLNVRPEVTVTGKPGARIKETRNVKPS